MWVKFKKTYSGHLGFFEGGRKKDLPESIVNQLPKKFYEESCPPWEEQTDPAAIAVIATHTKAAEAAQLAEKLQRLADETDRYRDELVPVASAAQSAASDAQAAEKAVEAAKKADIKSKSENEKKKYRALLSRANELVAVYNRVDLESQKASGLLTAAVADAGLKHLDANAAETAADQLTADAKAETKKPAEEKAAAAEATAEAAAAEAAAAEAAAADDAITEAALKLLDEDAARARADELAADAKAKQESNGSENAEQKDQAKKTDAPQGDNSEPEG